MRGADEEEGSHAGTNVRFVNAVAERVAKVYPQKVIETLAYQYTRRPPAKTRLRDNVMPCLCSIECDCSRPISTGLCEETVRFRDDIEGWNFWGQAPRSRCKTVLQARQGYGDSRYRGT